MSRGFAVREMNQLRRWRLPAKVATAVAMAGFLLLASLLALDPHLHRLVHQSDVSGPEAPSSANHQCAATLLAKGALEAPAPASLGLCFDRPPQSQAVRPQSCFIPAVPYRLLPERAPPVS